MRNVRWKRGAAWFIVVLSLFPSYMPLLQGRVQESDLPSDSVAHEAPPVVWVLDGQFIYNVTENLSRIIFTEYNESQGEIAKGRAYGSAGEHRAADILAENMSKYGLVVEKQQLHNTKDYPNLTRQIEVKSYRLCLHRGNDSGLVDCFPAVALLGPRTAPFNRTCVFNYSGLEIRTAHPKRSEHNVKDYALLQQRDTIAAKFLSRISNTVIRFYARSTLVILSDLYDYLLHPHCKIKIYFDANNDTHDIPANQKCLPRFFINGSTGTKINASPSDYTMDAYLKQEVNESIISYNVIGRLNGSDSTKTIIIGCLYDSWWCQGTADSAIGMAIVLGIAKYFNESKIQPYYTLKFIGYAGEEAGLLGAKYYEATHRNETILAVIDLNQLGFKQDDPRLTLQIVANTPRFLEEVWAVARRTDYTTRTGNVTDIEPLCWRTGHLSDDKVFALHRPFQCSTVCFLKNGDWLLHHRDGVGHTEGDVLRYYDPLDVSVTSEMILNVTLALTLDSPLNGFL